MRVVIFGGTTEGRTLSYALAQKGAQVTVCVATEMGREVQGATEDMQVHTGRLTAAEMATLLHGAALCVDATHPYAVEATKNIRAAAQQAGVSYRRLLRGGSALPEGSVVLPSTAQAAVWLRERPGRILLTTGAKELPAFACLQAERLYPRVLPVMASLAACEAAGIPHRNILAMQGPFSQEMNEAILRQFKIRYLVTKDGGVAGGFPEKAAAAAETGTQLLVICRPEETGGSYHEILQECEEQLRCK